MSFELKANLAALVLIVGVCALIAYVQHRAAHDCQERGGVYLYRENACVDLRVK